jgi:hypothetical protein
MSKNKMNELEDEIDEEDIGTAAPPGIPPPQPIATVNPLTIYNNSKLDFMEQVNKIQSKYKKAKPLPTEIPPNAIKITKPPKKVKTKPTPIPTPTTITSIPTPKSTILINEEMIESFSMMDDLKNLDGQFATSKRVFKIIFLALLFYVLANKRSLAFTNSLHISSRVDSFIIHSIIYALLSYVILVI